MNPTPQIPTLEIARTVLQTEKVALFVVAYEAERHITATLERIPRWLIPLLAEIYVIDDSSTDHTVSSARAFGYRRALRNFTVMKTPHNLGYGGNQKVGYTYALIKGHDIVILLHGDGQYPPEYLPALIACYADSTVDAVFGSRMLNKTDALRGGMPLYKWIGNQILTTLENKILETSLSEFHSGYRSYRTRALRNVPFHLNSDDFHFDTDIIIQLSVHGSPIREIPIPTHYGDEACRVAGFPYAWNCLLSAVRSRLHRLGIFYQPNFEIRSAPVRNYRMKRAETSLHAYILRLAWRETDRVADLGANDGELAALLAKRCGSVTAADLAIPPQVAGVQTMQCDLNGDLPALLGAHTYTKVLALDVVEHLLEPERTLSDIHTILTERGLLFASTANIGFLVMRLTHLLGWFNYGQRGILDRTHHRLFTVHSFKRAIRDAGFQIVRVRGFGPPIRDAFGTAWYWRLLDSVAATLARWYPPLFAFNFLVIARKKPTPGELTRQSMTTIDVAP